MKRCVICNGPLPANARYNQITCCAEHRREKDRIYMKTYNKQYHERKREPRRVESDTTKLQQFLGAKFETV